MWLAFYRHNLQDLPFHECLDEGISFLIVVSENGMLQFIYNDRGQDIDIEKASILKTTFGNRLCNLPTALQIKKDRGH